MTTRTHWPQLVVTVAVIAFTLGVASPALANIAHYDVRVDGIACPFCAYGLEKKLKKLPGVTNLDIDLDAGRASFDVAAETVLMPTPVREAVREAGFTSREITVRAIGTVRGGGNNLSLNVGSGQSLQLRGGSALEQLRALVRSGHRDVVITGAITRSGDAWRLDVGSVRHRASKRKP